MKKILLFSLVSLLATLNLSAQYAGLSNQINPVNQDHSIDHNEENLSLSNTLIYSEISENETLNSSMVCADIALGTVMLESDTICFLDSLIFSIDTATIPTEPVGLNGFVWGVFTADVSASLDPFNEVSFLGAFGGVLAAPIEIANIYDLNLGIADGTFYITPIVLGGAIDTDGSFGGLDFTDGCVLTGTSLPFLLLPTFTPMNVTADVVPATSGNNGEITANASGGSGDYSYLWSTAETTAMISGLTVGTYTVTVSDNVNECVDDFVLEVMVTGMQLPDPCDSIAIGTVAFAEAIVCFNDSLIFEMTGETVIPQSTPNINGFAYAVHTADVSGSLDPFNEASFLGAFGGILPNPIVISNLYDGTLGLPAGTYFITPVVLAGTIDTDGSFTGLDFSDGCILTGASAEFTLLEEFPPLVVTSSSVDEIIPPGNNGEASVTVTGGTDAYTYLWSNGETTSSITGLASGTYSVTITDDSGCLETTAEVVLDQILDVNNIEGTKHFDLFPNPASETTMINYAFEQTLNLQISVFNNLGQLVYHNEVNNVSEGNLDLNLSTFTNGVYFVQLSNGTSQNIKRLIVNK